jgi:hypothetical protein
MQITVKLTPLRLSEVSPHTRLAPLGWWRRLLIRALVRLGAPPPGPPVEDSYTTIDLDRILTAVDHQLCAVQRTYGFGTCVIVVGRDEMARLYHEVPASPFSVCKPRDPRIGGNRVVYLPWVEGMCVIPRGLLDER